MDSQVGIARVQASLGMRTVRLAVDIDKFAFVIEHLEAVCEARWHDKRA